MVINNEGEINKDEFIIKKQTPPSGITVYKDSKVYVD